VAASPRPPSWAIGHTEFNAGVLRLRPDSHRGSERALPHLRDAEAPWVERVGGAGFNRWVELW